MRRTPRSLAAVLAVLLIGWVWGHARPRPPTDSRTRQPPGSAPAPASRSATAPSAPESENPAEHTTRAAKERAGVFGSAAGCAAAWSAGERLRRDGRVARFASFNLHWFPDGVPGKSEHGADLAWLSCALAWLDADVIAVQEVKQTPEAQQALSTLLAELNRLSGARYRARVDDCQSRVPQHVGLIWNEARVSASDFETVAALNPSGEACKQELRPGFAGRMRFAGGLDLTVVSAHFKSLADERAYALRGASFQALPGVVTAATSRARDLDWLLLGDLNTMGCDACAPAVSSVDEIALRSQQLGAVGLRLVPADARGSELSEGRLSLLDHAIAAQGMRELPLDAKSHVAGVCADPQLVRGRAAKQLRRALSDHCPIVLDLMDKDDD